MSRIRSIHPGLWTDDAFMSLSAFARLLMIGLWTEAYDDGVFKWKPRTLKARIFPADNADIEALLAELVASDFIKEGDGAGEMYGLIRNFRTFQRPKKPNSSGLLRKEDHQYVGLVEDQYGTDEEKSPQMEDGGGRVEEEDKSSAPVPVAVAQQGARVEFEDVWEAFPRNPSSSRDIAKAEWERTKPADRPDILKASIRRAQWFGQDCETRGRTVEEGERYEPHLAKWLKGAWRDSLTLPVKGEADPSLAVVRPGTDDFAALERHRGGKITLYGESLTVTLAELAQARANLKTQESVH